MDWMRTLTVLTVLSLCIPVHAQSAHSPIDPATVSFADIDWTVADAPAPADRATFSAPRSQGEAHPPPRHTGFKALLFETASDFNTFPRRTSTWVILGIGGAAAAGAHHFDATVNQRLVGSETADAFFKAGKYIGSAYVQAGAAVGLYVVGRYVMPHAADAPKTNKVSHLGFDLLRGLIVSQTITQAMKVTIQRDRPTGECCAFPSGHASAAFATASVIERHLGYRGAIPTYAIAAYVAASRMHDNRHYLSDVVFGAALGIASGWTVVGRHGRDSYALVPAPVPRGFAINLIRSTE
jgi:membrane-associated phospholipid phosphatase